MTTTEILNQAITVTNLWWGPDCDNVYYSVDRHVGRIDRQWTTYYTISVYTESGWQVLNWAWTLSEIEETANRVITLPFEEEPQEVQPSKRWFQFWK